MSKVAHYLQEHLDGEVNVGQDIKEFFSGDSGVLSVFPSMIVYPRNEQDIRKTVRFSWQLSERGMPMPVTARGLGGGVTGSALGQGAILASSAHLNKVLELDSKSGEVVIEPGISYGSLQQVLYTHNKSVESYNESLRDSTVGGVIATNASGIRGCVKQLRIVLANGEVIETKRLSKRELNKKLGLGSMEGEIYRQLDKIIEDNTATVDALRQRAQIGSSGYAIHEVKHADGSFDLTPLFVGSEGTLGVISEATLKIKSHSPSSTTLVVINLDDVSVLQLIVNELSGLTDGPSRAEIIDGQAISMIQRLNPSLLKGVIAGEPSPITVILEFDNQSTRFRKNTIKKFTKYLSKQSVSFDVQTDPEAQEKTWKIWSATLELTIHNFGGAKSLPVLSDAAVPPERLSDFLSGLHSIFAKHKLPIAVWGSALSGNLQARPMLNISQIGDRQKLFKLVCDYYELAISLGGTISLNNGDGRLAAPFLEQSYGSEIYDLFVQVKHAFDPKVILNPGVKLGTTLEDLKKMAVADYKIGHAYNFRIH